MTTTALVVFGAGGHGKVVADALRAAGLEIAGFLDDGRGPGVEILGLPVLGGAAWLTAHPGTRVALGIGDNRGRERIAAACVAAGAELVTVIHPRAVIAPSARIAPGTVVLALAVVNPDAEVGAGAILNTGCIVEHDCVIGAFAHVSPRAVLGGACTVGALAHLGIGATMLPGTAIGDHALVGGGAVVTRAVAPHTTVAGIPARPLPPR